MKKKELTTAIIFLVIVVSIGKTLSEYLTTSAVAAFGWLMFGTWVVWIVYAFRNNLDIPGVGPFNYQGGENQSARIVFTVSVVGIFMISAVSGWL